MPLEAVGPPEHFAQQAHRFPTAGRALELACGDGRASAWLASRGLEVTGLDVSPVAVELATDLARRVPAWATRCRFEVVDLDDGLPPGPPVDLVVCHLFRDVHLDAAIVARLRPGGLLAVAVLSEVGGSPGRHRARPGELLDRFGELEVVDGDEADGTAWLLARRPVDGSAG